jgi:hypothetical protein
MLGDCQRRIERFLNVLVRLAEQVYGAALNEDQRGALETALRYFRDAAPKHTADEEESRFPGRFPRLRRIESADVRALLARIGSLDHECADRSHGEVDSLGRLWLNDGSLPPEQASRLLMLLIQLRDLYLHHIAAEDNEVFPTAALAAMSLSHGVLGTGKFLGAGCHRHSHRRN